MRFLSPARFRPLLTFYTLFFVVPLAPRLATGQTSPNSRSRPHTGKVPAPADQEQFVSYWTSETGWKSELQLRNNLVGQDLIVTPALRLPDGTETNLAAVTIKPQEVKSVDLDTAITATAAPQLVGKWGSIVLRYGSAGYRNLYAAMMIRKTGHPIVFHIDATGESQAFQSGGHEGIWWLPKNSTSDYLLLTNQGKNPIPLDLFLYDASGKAWRQKILLGPSATSRYSVRQLVQASGLAGSYGGLKISTSAHAGSLDTLHFLYDAIAGFSAILKMFDYDPGAKLKERDYAKTSVWTVRAPMLALSNPDLALAFPPGTTLQPQLFLRNTTAKFINVTLRFNWRTATTTGKAPGPTLPLSPYETRRIDVAALQDGKTLPADANWASVIITTDSKPDELIAVAASYDQSLRYGAQTPFSDQLSFKWEGGMWEYDPYHSSIITAGNGGTKPTQAAFTIFYNQGTQKYELEQTLQPDEQMWIDVGKLIREQVPDKNGKVLPADLTSGSYEVEDLTNRAIGTLFEGKVIYDKTYGHVAYGCASCCGYSDALVNFDPLPIPMSYGAQNGVYSHDGCWGNPYDVSYYFQNWFTANAAIATTDVSGYHTGVSVGSTSSSTYGDLQFGQTPDICPIQTFSAGGGDNVLPGFDVGYNAYIAVDHITSATSCIFAGTFNTPYIYMGDANRGTYRTAEQIHVIPDLQNYSGYFEDTGQSRNYGQGSPANGPTSNLSNADEDGIANDCYLWNNANKIYQPFDYDVTFPYAHQAQVHQFGSAYNPLENSSATITWDMRTVLDTTNQQSPTAYVNYNHTCYPAHQIKVNGTVIYSYTPPDNSPPYLFDCLVSHINKVVGVTQPVVVLTH